MDTLPWAIPPALIWGTALSWMDFKERRLPNWLTVGAAAVALTWRFGYGGTDLFLRGFAAAAAAGFFLLIPFLIKGAGGGDVKMLFAAGAIVGWGNVLVMVWVASFVGLLLGIAMMVAGRTDSARMKHALRSLFDFRYDRRGGAAALPDRESEKVRIPFSLPITAGMLFAMVW